MSSRTRAENRRKSDRTEEVDARPPALSVGSLRAVSLAAALATVGCVTTRPRTELVVELDAEPGIAARAAAVRVIVRGGTADDAVLPDRFQTILGRESAGRVPFPVRFTVVPENDDPSRLYEVEVTARGDEGVLLGRQRIRGTYLAGRSTFVRIVLEDCCLDVAPRCAPNESCVACACEEVVVVDPMRDAGLIDDAPGLDAPGLDAARPDAGRDAGPVTSDGGCATASDCPPMPCQMARCDEGICVYDSVCTPGTVCCGGVCAPNCDCLDQRRGVVCRAAAPGGCDVEETCDGVSPACPPDAFAPSGTTCRPAAGECDVAETCTGFSAECPVDAFEPAGTRCSGGVCDGVGGCSSLCPMNAPCILVDRPCRRGRIDCSSGTARCVDDGPVADGVECRPAMGPCDVPETCTDGRCPADMFRPRTFECRASAGPCDVAETCTGSSAACPPDGYASSSVVCRPSAGPCDAPESCTGSSRDCPTDQLAPTSHVCRPAVSTCDAEERCDGRSAMCPSDAFVPAGTPCRPAADECDAPESCTGSSRDCPADVRLPDGTPCPRPCSACMYGFCLENCSAGEMCCPSTNACVSGGSACPFA